MSHPVAEEAPTAHYDALNLVRDALAAAADAPDALQAAVDVLHDRFPSYDWVGLYWVDEAADELVLGSWRGDEPTEHVRIPLGVGICGAAATSGQTEIVEDVNADPRYLACFTTTRSEIVVPIFADGKVIGEIDIDGTDLAAYDQTDARFLEEVAALLAPLRLRD